MGRVVLVVEDEPLLRMDAAAIVEDVGCEVLEAANADEAIDILETRPDVLLVFTDINMPGSMDGRRLAHVIRERWPPVLLLVVSGKDALAGSDLPVGARFISKPYDSAKVTATLNAMLRAA
jgi:CheY-like chemotaxis protein